jgi:hypothetical protein
MTMMMVVVAAVLVMHMMIVMRVVMGMIVMGMTVMGVVVGAMTVMMIVAVMLMTMVIMIIVSMAGLGVGPAFRIERRLDLDDARPQPLHHRFDHMVPANSQALGQDLGRQVPVAEMPGEPHQMMRIAGANFEQRLGRRHDLDQPAVLQHQGIATAKRGGVLEVEQECEPAGPGHRQTATVAIVEIEQDGIGSGLFPTMLPEHARGADHAEILIS